MKKIFSFFCALFVIFCFTNHSWADTYSATDIYTGTTPGAVVTAGTGLSTKTTNIGTIGVGTAGGVGGEIDHGITTEWIRLTFNTPQYINDIRVGFLYPSGQYGDQVNEQAAIITNLGTLYLQATGFTTATLIGAGTVGILENAQDPYGGVWDISDPFVSQPVNYVEFRAVQIGSAAGGANSDYSIVSVSTVPELTTMLLLSSGLIGLLGIRRMFKN